MHGTANDYIFFDCFDEALLFPEALSEKLSDRRRAVGGDGIILVEKSEICDAKMRIFNADGSEGNMCGNGIRCVGKFLHDIKGVLKETLFIETRAGVRTLFLNMQGGEVQSVTVDMGAPIFSPEKIPADFFGKDALFQKLNVGGEEYVVHCLSMGNPHCVVFCEEIDSLKVETLGALFERHKAFKNRVNTEFVQVLGRNRLKMRVYERGSGETFSCGTGACAAAVAAVCCGHAERNGEISVLLKGGELKIKYGKTVFMTGDCALSYRGTVEI